MKLLHAIKRQDVGLEVFDQDSKQITAYRKNISNILRYPKILQMKLLHAMTEL